MKRKNIYWMIAGVLNLLTFFMHLIGGQIELVNPMMDTKMSMVVKTQLLGAWHMVTLILLATSIVLLLAGLRHSYTAKLELISFVGYLNLAFCLPFVGASFYYGMLVPQWIFFLPIALLTFYGIKQARLQAA